ncbi:hypothetical protein RAO22_03135 [Pediococcus acidilactici]
MIEKFNRLLDDEQQLVLQMAELYIHDPEKKLSISYLQSELGVSRHQVLMAFDLLKDTVASLNLQNIDLAYDGKGIIAMYGLTTSLLKQLLEEMALRAIRLNVFINSQLGIYGTQSQFTKRFGISRATYYRNIMGIRQLFTEEIFNYRSMMEASLRQMLFSVIHHFFNGIDGLPGKYRTELPVALEQICTDYGMDLKYTERKRLVNFAFVQAQRINQGHVLKDLTDQTPVSAAETGPDFGPLNQFWELQDEALQREKQYLTVYCRVNELLDFSMDQCCGPQLQAQLQDLVDSQTELLYSTFADASLEKAIKQIKLALTKTNVKVFAPFYFSETFVDPTKMPFFNETYPAIDMIVKQLLGEVAKRRELYIDQDVLTQLYYTYMLILLEHLPVKFLSRTVKITVDFSNGPIFTKYIVAQLQQFAPLNIEIMAELTKETDIFLSDQSFAELDCEQMIWESPPLAADWEQLGDMIVRIKNQSADGPG